MYCEKADVDVTSFSGQSDHAEAGLGYLVDIPAAICHYSARLIMTVV